jgi:hypothetical protein
MHSPLVIRAGITADRPGSPLRAAGREHATTALSGIKTAAGTQDGGQVTARAPRVVLQLHEERRSQTPVG